jgi:hypothetical protein
LSKKRSAIQTFFSTTVQSFMPQFRNSEHYYEKRYKTDKPKANFYVLGKKIEKGPLQLKLGRTFIAY